MTKIVVAKEDWEWFKQMQEEARTWSCWARTYPLYKQESGKEVILHVTEEERV